MQQKWFSWGRRSLGNKIYRCPGFFNLINVAQFNYKYLLLDVTLNYSTLTYRYFYLRGYVYNPSGSWGYVTRARARHNKEKREQLLVFLAGTQPADCSPRLGQVKTTRSPLSLTHKRVPTDAAAWGTPPDILKQDLILHRTRAFLTYVLQTQSHVTINYWRTYLPRAIQIKKRLFHIMITNLRTSQWYTIIITSTLRKSSERD